MAKHSITEFTPRQVYDHVDRMLKEPNYRSLHAIAKEDYGTTLGVLKQKIKFAIPGYIVEYRKTGILLKHKAVTPESAEVVEAEEAPESE